MVICCFMVCLLSSRLVYNRTSKVTEPPDGVDIRVPGFGQTFSLEFLDPSKRSVGMQKLCLKSLSLVGFYGMSFNLKSHFCSLLHSFVCKQQQFFCRRAARGSLRFSFAFSIVCHFVSQSDELRQENCSFLCGIEGLWMKLDGHLEDALENEME